MHSAQTAILSQIELSPGERLVGGTFDATGVTTAIILLPGSTQANWKSAMEWAASIGGDLPNRFEQALLFATAKEEFEEGAYWSNVSEPGLAWCQDFYSGYQDNYIRVNELRARAVRRLIIQ